VGRRCGVAEEAIRWIADESDIDQTIVNLDPEDEISENLRRRLLLRRFWEAAAGFWRGKGRRASWFLTLGILLTIVFNLAVSYGMNVWNRAIFDGLEKHESSRVLFLSLIYFPLLASSVCIMATQVYPRMTA
jgi:putative ATP-binding cassette transporter